ncbi:MAG: ABC transporter permease [Chloroflexi bacterium]|nr:ABC transporter permease [Chloroflexota bacterium]
MEICFHPFMFLDDIEMARYIVRRLIRAAITLLVFQTILFLLIHALPWDAVDLIRVPSAYKPGLRRALGLDLPLWEQYSIWMRSFFTGDLGKSFQLGRTPVMSLFEARAPRTLLLFLPGAFMGFGLGLWLGKYIAWLRKGWLELSASVTGVIFYTAFAPWLAFVIVAVFALGLKWMPPENIINPNIWAGTTVLTETIAWYLLSTVAIGFLIALVVWRVTQRKAMRHLFRLGGFSLIVALTAYLWLVSGLALFALDMLHHLVLPLVTLILLTFGETMLLMRATMIDVLADDHVLTARAKGLSSHQVMERHVARLAIFPVFARFIVQLPLVIVGSFVIEKAFFWQGMGELLFRAVDTYDVPVVMGILSVVGALILVFHVMLDIIAAWLDPRLRVSFSLSSPQKS